ncbi:MAG: peptidoglycan DD-metalloendopeptidase family protein [Silicimonas sp.]|nr:peptidoglycan DD-metalloendopeptidase family protein [Silicimonas sp.]
MRFSPSMDRNVLRRAISCLVIVLAAVAMRPAPLGADASRAALEAADMLAAAAVQLDEADGRSDRIAALTATVRAYESGLSAMREGLRQASLQERALTERLGAEDRDLGQLFALLQTVSQRTGTEVLVHPGNAADTIRAGTLTASLVPALQESASELAAELDELKTLISVQAAGAASLEAGLEDVRRARTALADAIASRADLPVRLATDEAAMQALINSTETLAGFADSLIPDGAEVDLSNRGWVLPVKGQILRGFNEADAAGVRRPGLVITTASEALVTAPLDSTVRFSGEVPGQGTVAILEPKPGALVILAGMETSFVRLGEIVSAEAPIGLMGGKQTSEQQKLNESSQESSKLGQETLYMEVRQGRAPVDPAALLRLGEE